MVETTEKTGEKTLSVTPTKTLTAPKLKPRGVEQGVVRQSFSHGRTKQVLVEKVKSRAPIKARADMAPAGSAAAKPSASSKTAAVPTATGLATAPAPAPASAAPKPSGVVLRVLTAAEQSARAHALSDARLREAEERK